MLENSLPDGSYFSRGGSLALDGRQVAVLATGARTITMNVYFRTQGPPLGEPATIAALRRLGFTLQLSRCPVTDSPEAGSKWWRLSGAGKRAAWFQSRTWCDGEACEGYALRLGETLPSMTPGESRLYTDHCSDIGAAAPAVPIAPWDEQLASLFAALIPPAGSESVAWSALDQATAVHWGPLPPGHMKQPPWRDANQFFRAGNADLGGRTLYLTATGSDAQVLNVHADDQANQADLGDVLVALRQKGYDVRLSRCGRVYLLGTAHWYRVTRPGSKPVLLWRSPFCDTIACPKVQESYTLALTGTMPPLAPGEVDAIGGSCPGR